MQRCMCCSSTMGSFLRNLSLFTGREAVVKESLTSQLSSSVKEIQLSQTNCDSRVEPLGTDEVTNSLCTVLEALFIHGLKDTFMNRVTQAIGGDIDQRPEPTFWAPLLVFSHREIIDQVHGLFFVTTDVGRSRAWLRLVLNDGLLSSYLSSMKREGSALKPYYHYWAFLRDSELLDVAQRLLDGINNYPFALACNSSLLNVWTNQPLLLAGLWTPPLGACPVTAGVDVASTLQASEPDEILTPTRPPMPMPGSAIGSGSLNEDEALRIILGTPVDGPIEPIVGARPTDIPGRPDEATSVLREPRLEMGSSLGNSLTGRLGWSSSFEEEVPVCEVQLSQTSAILKTPCEAQSYHSLLENYNMSGSYVKTPDFHDFLDRYEGRPPDPPADIRVAPDGDDPSCPLFGLGYEIVPTSRTSLFALPEFNHMVKHLSTLCKEFGLDSQSYTCANCSQPLGMNFGKPKLCAFTGNSFCSECHVGEKRVIPARVILNWDFRRYSVARESAEFLEEIQHHPLLDLKVLNPQLYLVIEEMSQLQDLRIQLNFLRAYLFTCREPVIEELQMRVWPREYLYEHVHLYSVADLLQIPTGGLAQHLIKVVGFAREHVLTCWLCSQKGFICEVCNSNKVIYPFDTDTTYRCPTCSAVFHTNCLDSSKPCPKCQRKQKREDSPSQLLTDS